MKLCIWYQSWYKYYMEHICWMAPLCSSIASAIQEEAIRSLADLAEAGCSVRRKLSYVML